jgi:serine protease
MGTGGPSPGSIRIKGGVLTTKKMITFCIVLCCLVGCSQEPDAEYEDTQTDSYILVFKKEKVDTAATHFQNLHRASLSSRAVVSALLNDVAYRYELPEAQTTFSVALQGGLYQMTESQAAKIKNDPMIAYIEKDQIIQVTQSFVSSALQSQAQAPWGLDRMDQNSLPLNQTYSYSSTANNVNVYVIDTGILTTHQEFGGRAVSAIDLVDQDSDATDCNGHGTHVAGSIGSSTYGVAKNVKLYGVRVLNCAGSGSFSAVISGIEWVTANHVKPAIANMSLGGGISQAVDDAVTASIHAGVTYVVAAGNENSPACNSSPARVSGAITVGSSTSLDARSSFSNYGSCVSVFAPGSDILSTWIGSSVATHTISGTSMAAPHVAGLAALYVATHPSALPAEIKQAIIQGSLSGKISSIGLGSPNLLVNTSFLVSEAGGGSGGSELQNPGELKNLIGSSNSERYFSIDIPINTESLVIEIAGGSGDVDLYVMFGDKPSRGSFECRPYKVGNNESCIINQPQAGQWYVLLHGYDAYSGVSLKSSFVKKSESAPPCSDCTKYSGQLIAKGQSMYLPGILGVTVASGLQQVRLQGPAGSDFDLFLYKKNGSNWQQVASSNGIQSLEQISYQGTTGTYRVKVISYSGTGKFDLWIKSPKP